MKLRLVGQACSCSTVRGGGALKGETTNIIDMLRTEIPPTSSTCCELRHHQHQRRAALLGLNGEDLARAARAAAAATCAGCCELRHHQHHCYAW